MRRILALAFFAACAIVLSACATFGNNKPAACASCGTVMSIAASSATHANAGGSGVVLGGIVGGVANAQPAQPAKPAPPAGYDIRVRMDDGREVVVHQAETAGLRPNAPARVINGRVVAATTVTAKP